MSRFIAAVGVHYILMLASFSEALADDYLILCFSVEVLREAPYEICPRLFNDDREMKCYTLILTV